MSQSPTQNNNKNAQKSAIFYIIVLFSAAFIFLFVSLLMQQRTSEAAITELTDSLSAIAPLEKLIEENQTLSATLSDTKDALSTQTSQLLKTRAELFMSQKNAEALLWLVSIQNLTTVGELEDAKIALIEFQDLGLPAYLPTSPAHGGFSAPSPAEQYQELLLALS